MANAVNNTTFAAALKRMYPANRIRDIVFKDNPFWALLPKADDFYGASISVPFSYGDPMNRSASFSQAQTNSTTAAGAGKYEAWLVSTLKSDYAIGTVSSEIIERSAKDPAAFARAVDSTMKKSINNLKRSLNKSLWRTSTGNIATVTAGTSSPITVSKADAHNLEVGMIINAVSDDTGSGTVRSGDGTITAINRSTGVVTYTGTITSLAVGDLLHVKGDYNAKLAGVAMWIPTTAPTSASFFGVDRSADTTRMGGIRVTASGAPIEEAIQSCLAECGLNEASPDYAFFNPLDLSTLALAMGSKVERESISVGGVGFTAIKIASPCANGVVKALPDANVPQGKVYFLQMDTWKFHHLGEVPKVIMHDGQQMLRQGTDDGIEFRLVYRGELVCDAPGYNAVLSL